MKTLFVIKTRELTTSTMKKQDNSNSRSRNIDAYHRNEISPLSSPDVSATQAMLQQHHPNKENKEKQTTLDDSPGNK